MMNHFLTDDVFNAGITDYLNAKKFRNAEQRDLWNALTSAARRMGDFDTDVAVVMDSWTLQTGFPVLNVIRNYDTGVIQFSQVCLLTLIISSYSQLCKTAWTQRASCRSWKYARMHRKSMWTRRGIRNCNTVFFLTIIHVVYGNLKP